MNQTMALPVLYSLRNCPYAMRARLAIYASGQQVHLRDIILSNKPAEMLIASPKGSVPVLVLPNKSVIDESLEIMRWAFSQSDPEDYQHQGTALSSTKALPLIYLFDNEFKGHLEKYRCSKRYHETTLADDRKQCEHFIADLELRLCRHSFLISDKPSLADLAIMPFIRQFAKVERQWYLQSPYPKLRQWLNGYLQSAMFSKVMAQHPMWLESKQEVVFGREVSFE